MAGVDDGGFSEKQCVTFVGLVGRADLNGKSGKLVRFDSSTGRWLVTSDREDVNVRAANLQAASAIPVRLPEPKVKAKAKPKVQTQAREAPVVGKGLKEGSQVVFVGLSGRADLNGTEGTLGKLDRTAGRWAVTVANTDEEVNVRPVNLQLSGSSLPAVVGKAKNGGFKATLKRKLKTSAGQVQPKEVPVGQGLKEGRQVVFVGLSGRADLNGLKGTLGKLDRKAGRWMVAVATTGEEVNVRPINLQLFGVSRPAVVTKAKKGGFKTTLKRKLKSSGDQAQRSSAPRKGIARAKPKRALSAYQIFSNRVREEIMNEHRARYGSVDPGMLWSEIGERWADLEDKERKKYERQAEKRRETVRGKMQAYQEVVDPLGALKKKYEHLIPKGPTTPFFLFNADEAQRKKASEEIKSSGSTMKLATKLTEMWKALPVEEKVRYETQYAKDKAEFQQKTQVWQKTKEYAELEALESKQKEAERAKKQAKKVQEDNEMQELLKDGVRPGVGLAAGRSATIVGLTGRDDLNDKEIELVEFITDAERWVVKLTDTAQYTLMNVRPANLLLVRLVQEAEKAKKKEEGEAAKKQRKLTEKQELQELLKDGAAPGKGLASGRCAVTVGLTSREDLNGIAVRLEEFNEETGRWRVIQAYTGEPMNLRPENLILAALHAVVVKQEQTEKRKEIQREAKAARDAAKLMHSQAKLAAREAAKEADKAFMAAVNERVKGVIETSEVENVPNVATRTWSADIECLE